MSDLSQKPPVTLITGPARSGKSTRIIDLTARALRSGAVPLLLVPSSASARLARERLLDTAGPLRGDVVLTFVSLAERLLAAAGRTAHEISPHERDLLLRKVSCDLAASGRLPSLAGVLDTAGFYRALSAFIRELKTFRIEPAKFAEADFPKTTLDLELSRIYSTYQQILKESALYDAEGRFWLAINILENDCPLSPTPSLLLLDGFTDFTPNETALLKALAAHLPAAFITLPHEDSRPDLFEKTSDTLRRLRCDFAVTIRSLSDVFASPPLARIASSLFDPAPPAPAPPADSCVKVISTAGVRMEMTEIAREAAALIRAGAVPSRIALLARNARRLAAAARDAFARLSVPLDLPTSSSGESRLFPFLHSIVDLVVGGFARRDVEKLLTSSYVDLEAFALAPLSPADVPAIAREAAVVRGLPQWRSRLAALSARITRFAQTAPPDPTPDENENEDESQAPPLSAPRISPDRIAALLAALERLHQLVSPFDSPAPASQMASVFSNLLDAFSVRTRIAADSLPEDVLFRDLSAFAAIDDTLRELSAASLVDVPLSARAFVDLLSDASQRAASSGGLSQGGVRFLDLASARNLSFDYVFICGLTSDAYPASFPLGPFYSRSQRQRLELLGLASRSEKMHAAAERLLFYQAATRAEKTLYLTFPATDEAGKPRLPSSYLSETLSLFADGSVPRRDHGPSSVLPTLDDAASPVEVALAAGLAVSPPDSDSSVIQTASRLYPQMTLSLRAAAVESHRDSFQPPDSFDGLLSPGVASAVADRFPPSRPWSATRLARYSSCPFAFFLTDVLGALRPDEPGPVPDPRAVGTLAHDVLARFFRTVEAKGLAEQLDSETTSKKIPSIFDEAFASITSAHARRLGITGDPFWNVEKMRIRRMLASFLNHEIARLAPRSGKDVFVPAFFELPFGLPSAAHGFSGSARVPLAIDYDGRREFLIGRIDRIDFILSPPDAENPDPRTRIAVIDYKLSSAPTGPEVTSLADMQMPLYLYAAAFCTPGLHNPLPSKAFYRVVKTCKGVKPVISFDSRDEYDAFIEKLKDRLFPMIDILRDGYFAPTPRSACPPFCPGRGICRHSDADSDEVSP